MKARNLQVTLTFESDDREYPVQWEYSEVLQDLSAETFEALRRTFECVVNRACADLQDKRKALKAQQHRERNNQAARA